MPRSRNTLHPHRLISLYVETVNGELNWHGQGSVEKRVVAAQSSVVTRITLKFTTYGTVRFNDFT